jgi:hypothetical protein
MSTGELVCIAQACFACVSLSLFSDLGEVAPARAFYSSRSGSYIETRGPTGGAKVVETLYNI